MARRSVWLPLFILVGLSVCLWKALFQDVQAVPSPLVGKKLPEITGPELYTRHSVSLEKYRGKPFIIHVFASWCGYCEAEHRFILKLKPTLKFPIIGLDYRDSDTDAKAWLKRLKNPYDVVLLDSLGLTGFSLGVYGTPEWFLIDAKGVIRQKWAGPVDEAIWKKAFVPVIATF